MDLCLHKAYMDFPLSLYLSLFIVCSIACLVSWFWGCFGLWGVHFSNCMFQIIVITIIMRKGSLLMLSYLTHGYSWKICENIAFLHRMGQLFFCTLLYARAIVRVFSSMLGGYLLKEVIQGNNCFFFTVLVNLSINLTF